MKIFYKLLTGIALLGIGENSFAGWNTTSFFVTNETKYTIQASSKAYDLKKAETYTIKPGSKKVFIGKVKRRSGDLKKHNKTIMMKSKLTFEEIPKTSIAVAIYPDQKETVQREKLELKNFVTANDRAMMRFNIEVKEKFRFGWKDFYITIRKKTRALEVRPLKKMASR